jgi:undecaprenyl-diphosphatase
MDAATLPSFVQRRLDRRERYGLRLTLFGIAIVLAVLPFGFLLDQVVDEGPLTVYDKAAAEELHEVVREEPWTRTPLEVVSFLGKPIFFYVLVGGICIWLFVKAQRRIIAYLVTTGLGGGAVDTAAKVLVDRDRPDLEGAVHAFGRSFPSGHSFTSTMMYGALLVAFYPRIPKPWKGPAIAGYVVIVAAIGFSRLALGAHFLTDVLGGVILGAAWLVAATAAFRMWKRGD